MEITGSFHVNPREVEYQLERATFRYPRNSEVDDLRGFGQVPVIPTLFAATAQARRFLTPDEGVRLLMARCDPSCAHDPRVRRRADKLYLDFARDMHTLGLLQRSEAFGVVDYQKVLALRYNIDFVASLGSWIPEPLAVGVQAAMRANWAGVDSFEKRKAVRRAYRQDEEWEGPMYWLTNRTRPPAKNLAGCWLFGEKHVTDLAEQIHRDHGLPPIVGLQLDLF